MATKPRIDVVLTASARQELQGEAIYGLLDNGDHFNCISVQQEGSFLNLKAVLPHKTKRIVLEVTIPLQFVLYMLSVDAAKALGFK